MLSERPTLERFGPGGIVDDEFGLIRWVTEVPQDPGDPKIFNYAVQMAATDEYLPLICFTNNGGASLTRDFGRRAALGEAVERYCSSVLFPEDLVLGTHVEMSRQGRALGPAELQFFHAEQLAEIGYPPFTETTPLTWTQAWSLTRKEPVMVPASLIFLPYYRFFEDDGELTIGPGISTGQASAYSYTDALLGGLYEVVERDAVSIFWLNRLPLREIDISSNPRLDQVHRERFAREGLEWRLFDMTTDIAVPSVFCVMIDHQANPPMICTGGATHAKAENAAMKALVEAAQTLQWAKYLGRRDEPFIIRSDHANITDFEHHVFLYAYGDRMEAMRFLLDAKDKVPLSAIPDVPGETPAELLRSVRAMVEAAGGEVLAADLTSEDVASCGYRVVKVMAPLLQPLEGDHTHRFLAGPRIYEVPARLGYPAKSRPDQLNPDPHPYP